MYGELTSNLLPGAEDEFRTHAQYVYADRRELRPCATAKPCLHRLSMARPSRAGFRHKTPMREVMFVDRNMRDIFGRWFNGAYDEIGIDVKHSASETIRWCSVLTHKCL